MGYVTSNLMNNEEVVHMAKVHWFIYMPGLMLLAISIYIMFNSKGADGAISIAVILFFIGLYSLAKAFIQRISTELAITNKRVIAKTGFISRDTVELNHGKVESFNIDQSIFGRIFNFGNVIIQGTGGGKTPIPNIDDPMLFRREAMQVIDVQENN